MVEQGHLKAGIIVLSRPIKIGEEVVYGLLIGNDKIEDEGFHQNMSEYITILIGAEHFTKNGGHIDEDLWTYPDGEISFVCNRAVDRLLYYLFKNEITFELIENDSVIEWTDDEVDDLKGTPCFILKPSLIERYTNKVAWIMKNLTERKDFIKVDNSQIEENKSALHNIVKLPADRQVLRFEDFVRQKKAR